MSIYFYKDLLPIIKTTATNLFAGGSTSTTDQRGIWTLTNTTPDSLNSYYGFDKDPTTLLRTSINTAVNTYVELTFPSNFLIGKYKLELGGQSLTWGNMASWDIIARVDGVWVTVHSGTNEQVIATKEYEFTPVIADGLRIKCTGKHGTNSWGFGDFYLYEVLPANKSLILHDGEYKKYNSKWETISSTLPTKDQFIAEGMDVTSPLLDRRLETLEPLLMTDKSNILQTGETGKLFSKTIDLKKYVDIRNVEVN